MSSARVVPGRALRLNPDGTDRLVPGMPSGTAVAAVLTDDFGTVRRVRVNRVSGAGTSAAGPAVGRFTTTGSADCVSAPPVSSSKTSCAPTPATVCRACRRGVAAPLYSLTISGMSGTSCTTTDSNGRVSVVAACGSAGHWCDGVGRGGGACHRHRLAPCAAPRHGRGDGLDAPAVSLADNRVRTGIDPNVEAGADLARRIPVAVCIRFAVRAVAGGDDPVWAAVVGL